MGYFYLEQAELAEAAHLLEDAGKKMATQLQSAPGLGETKLLEEITLAGPPDGAICEFGPGDTGLLKLYTLIEARAEQPLMHALHSSDVNISELAVIGLLECWANEHGEMAREELQRAESAMDMLELEIAESCLLSLVYNYPSWSEPLCTLANLRYMQGRFEESIALHHRVLSERPHHFPAWHGLALTATEQGNWDLALHAIQQTRRLRPHHEPATMLEQRIVEQCV